nr:helix-turn-helix domain-containing protein [Iamia sp. SCSIO 61187]
MGDETTPCEVFVADCRVRAATDLLRHRWDPVVLLGLRAGPQRRVALRSAIGGISDKALSESLGRLVSSGLLTREREVAAPPRVRYGLSPLGRTLVDGPLAALGEWAVEHAEELLDGTDPWADDAGAGAVRSTR